MPSWKLDGSLGLWIARLLYQEGSSYGDLVGQARVPFAEAGPALLEALDSLVANYDGHHVNAIDVPSMEEVASKQYLSINRWCFYEACTVLEEPIYNFFPKCVGRRSTLHIE
jgi:hypothetical protein